MAKPAGFSEAPVDFNLQAPVHATLGADGRLLIPAAIRDAAGIKRGDKLLLRVEDGKVVVESFRSAILRIQKMLAPLKKPGESIVDEFLAERRAMWGEDE